MFITWSNGEHASHDLALTSRHVNKEKMILSESQARFAERSGPALLDTDGKTAMRIRDVYYWYIDYRDFADVVKYRIAMMRKGIDEKVKEVGIHLAMVVNLLTMVGDWCQGIHLPNVFSRV
jgi:hypothetical protein